MKRALPLILLILFIPVSQGVSVEEGADDLVITVELPEEANPPELDPELFLCSETCEKLELKSFSFSGNELQLFALPRSPGEYELKVYLTVNGERVSFHKEITVEKAFAESSPPKENGGITGNITRNAFSPLFGLGILALFLVFFFLKEGKTGAPRESKIKYLAIFLVSFLFLASFTHEFFHILTAGMFNCPAVLESFIPVYQPTSVFLTCEAGVVQSVLILASGLLGNLALGVVFYLLYLKKGNAGLSVVSFAFLSSTFFYLFYGTGDIHSIMRILGFHTQQVYMNMAGVSLILTTFYFLFRNQIQNMGTNPRYHRNM